MYITPPDVCQRLYILAPCYFLTDLYFVQRSPIKRLEVPPNVIYSLSDLAHPSDNVYRGPKCSPSRLRLVLVWKRSNVWKTLQMVGCTEDRPMSSPNLMQFGPRLFEE